MARWATAKRSIWAAVDAFAGAGFVDCDFGEVGEAIVEVVPDPAGEVFAGGVFQAGDIVEVAVVELFFEGSEGFFEVGEVHQPAGDGIDRAADGDFDAEGVTVEAGALVAFGGVG